MINAQPGSTKMVYAVMLMTGNLRALEWGARDGLPPENDGFAFYEGFDEAHARAIAVPTKWISGLDTSLRRQQIALDEIEMLTQQDVDARLDVKWASIMVRAAAEQPALGDSSFGRLADEDADSGPHRLIYGVGLLFSGVQALPWGASAPVPSETMTSSFYDNFAAAHRRAVDAQKASLQSVRSTIAAQQSMLDKLRGVTKADLDAQPGRWMPER